MKAKTISFIKRYYLVFLSLFFALFCAILTFLPAGLISNLGMSSDNYLLFLQLILIFIIFLVFGTTIQYLVNKEAKKEFKTQHVNQILRAIRDINQVITYEKDKDSLIQNACQMLIEIQGYQSAWIALYDQKENLGSFAQAGLEKNISEHLKTHLESENLYLYCQKALQNSKTTIINLDLDSTYCQSCPLYRRFDKNVTVRLEYSDQVFGFLSVGSVGDFFARDEEKDLIEELSRDIAFALHNLESEKKRLELHHDFWILAEQAPWGLSIMHPDHRFEYFNPQFTRIFGYTLQELPDKETWFKKAYPDPAYREKVISIWENDVSQTEKTGKSMSRVFTIRCKNGTDKLVSLKTIATIQGKHFLSYDDITEQEQAQEELKKSEEKFRGWFEASPDPLFLLNNQGEFIDLSPSSVSKLGFSKQEIIGSSLWNCPFFPKESIELTTRKFETRKTGQEVPPYSLELLTKVGSKLYVEVNVGQFKEQGRFAGEIVIARDVTQRKLMEDKLRFLSFYDPLTGLYNRRLFEEEINRLGDGRYSPIGIIVCDIDGLKLINDTLGHEKGDELLQLAADILKNCFRESDVVARIGGDEFAILLPYSSHQVITESCSRIRKTIEQYNAQSPILYLNLSIGYAVDTNNNPLMHELFRQADDNMYQEKLKKRSKSRENILQSLVTNMETRDFFNQGHAERLKKYALKLGTQLGLSKNQLNDLDLLARFHDLGKVGIPETIIFKSGRLTEEELQTIRKHSEIGYRIGQSMPDLQPIAEYILKHHEWWNGQGYPLGLQGEDIPLECRIISIVDAYDIMTSNRPYHQAITAKEAIAELRKKTGIQFDPELVEQFIHVLEEAK